MTQPVAPEKIQAVVDAYIAAISAGDVEGVMVLFGDHPTVEDPVGSGVVEGREAVRAFYERACAVPMTAFASGPARIAGREVAFPFVLEVADGEMTIDVIDNFRFDDEGRIAAMRAWWGETNMR